MKQRTPGEILTHPLWMLPMFVGCMLLMIESVHTLGHLRMEMDVHGYCMQNKEHLERMDQDDDDW